MSENEAVENTAPEATGPSKGKKFVAGLKERIRKFVVSLKRKPQNIPFFVLVISSVVFMCSLVYFSQVTIMLDINWAGFLIFVNTMFSVLTLLLFMNTFPKRKKKINVVMLVATFVFMAVMLFCDFYWWHLSLPKYNELKQAATDPAVLDSLAKCAPSFTSVWAHFVLVALSAILLATLPLYKKLILKINTTKVLEENKLSEEIDTSAEV